MSRLVGLKRTAIWVAIIGGGLGIAGVLGGAGYKAVAWASTRVSDDECDANADAAEAGAVEAVRVHQSLEAEIHKAMIQRADHHENTMERHTEEIDKTNTEILYILREWRKNGHPPR